MDEQQAPQAFFSKRAAMVVAAVALAGVGIVALSLSVYSARDSAVQATTTPAPQAAIPLTHGAWPKLAERGFYEQVREQFITEEASFITLDLESMTLTLYQQGLVGLEVPIADKGKEGTWRETPAGLYRVQSKTENHFSSFDEAYWPWSLGFQGSCFIHGSPEDKDGTPIASDEGGSCVHLLTEDARALYEFTAVGMPVVVYSAPSELSSFTYAFKTPDISATAFATVDLGDGTVLAGQNTSVQLPIASVTKLMTALVAVEYFDLERSVSAPAAALVSTVVPRLAAGKAYRVYDLVAVMLAESSNEAAEVLAHAVGRDEFVALMNEKAQTLGMGRTSFIDPTGLGVGNSSTAEDLFTLIKYLYESRRFVLNITSDSLEQSLNSTTAFGRIQNFNLVKEVPNVFWGGKIGNTNAARQTYLGVFGLKVQGAERPVVVVVLGAENSHKSVITLLNYLNEFYDLNPKPE